MDGRKHTLQKVDWHYVYVVQCAEACHNIGVAHDMQRRLLTLNNACPLPLKLVYKHEVSSGQRAKAILREVHKLLKYQHRRHGWFNVMQEQAEEAILRSLAVAPRFQAKYIQKIRRTPSQELRRRMARENRPPLARNGVIRLPREQLLAERTARLIADWSKNPADHWKIEVLKNNPLK